MLWQRVNTRLHPSVFVFSIRLSVHFHVFASLGRDSQQSLPRVHGWRATRASSSICNRR